MVSYGQRQYKPSENTSTQLDSGSLEHMENNQRLDTLYRNHDTWLRKVAMNLSGNQDVVDDLVQELYLYLATKNNPKLYYLDSFNLKYCHSFLQSRWRNLINREKKSVYPSQFKDGEMEEYNPSWDNKLYNFEQDVLDELRRLEKTNDWAQAKIYKMYQFSDRTMEELSKDIGISKSTTFMSVKKIKLHLQQVINKPTKTEDDE